MDIGAKAKVLAVSGERVAIEIEGKRKYVPMRGDLKLKRGDTVVLAFGSIIDKV